MGDDSTDYFSQAQRSQVLVEATLDSFEYCRQVYHIERCRLDDEPYLIIYRLIRPDTCGSTVILTITHEARSNTWTINQYFKPLDLKLVERLQAVCRPMINCAAR